MDEKEKVKPTKVFPVLYRYEPTGEPAHEFLEMPVSDEWLKLETQLKDERFLTKAPAAAIEKVKARLAKLQAEIIIPVYCNHKLDEGEWGYEWHRMGRTSIWVYYPDFRFGETGRNRYGIEFTFPDERSCENAWTGVNEYWTSPVVWEHRAWEQRRLEAEEAQKKEYLRLKAIYEPDSATSGNVD